MITLFYDIEPTAKPRMTRRDKWAKRPAVVKYHAFKDRCKELDISVKNGDTITFYIAMPKSWSKKKQLEMMLKPHENRPDVDNLLKAIMDATLPEDSHISDITVKKRWNDYGAISIERPHK